MPVFLSQTDVNYMISISKEMVDEIIGTKVLIYAIDPETPNNLYGESTEKIYLPPIDVSALIDHTDQNFEHDMAGQNVMQAVSFGLIRNEMKEKNFYPTVGDIIKWNNSYFEINEIVDNQLIGGRVEYKHSIICKSHMTNKSIINVRYEQGTRI
jgi:hypothetical protein